ncbi:unnamed protein product [Polarella glacialis]|uniref:Uncharacterized protein n=1 Tax=Polarella glacialis TaxID=89957 RepID=A0A813I1P5_POLGL|nr:unnamed protein product [Polarella glacialis]CAE8643728.1 unnamed protein product [Polarella glacialis]
MPPKLDREERSARRDAVAQCSLEYQEEQERIAEMRGQHERLVALDIESMKSAAQERVREWIGGCQEEPALLEEEISLLRRLCSSLRSKVSLVASTPAVDSNRQRLASSAEFDLRRQLAEDEVERSSLLRACKALQDSLADLIPERPAVQPSDAAGAVHRARQS